VNTHKLTFQPSDAEPRAVAGRWQLWLLALLLHSTFLGINTPAQRRKPPAGGPIAVVVDERLSALRGTPRLTGKLLRRLGRGRLVAIRGIKKSPDGVFFFLVNVTSRTHGWIQREAVVSATHQGDDQKLFRLINGSTDFERIARAQIFLDQFPRSAMRPEVLLLFGDAAEGEAARLSRDASRRLSEREQGSSDAPAFSYFLNYSGLDRYNRQGVDFIFDAATKRFHYDGRAWREIVRRYAQMPQANEARKRLRDLATVFQNSEP